MSLQRLGICLWVMGMFACFTQASRAQGGPGRQGGGWGPQSDYARLYDPGTVETLEGEVVELSHFVSPQATGRGVHLMLKTSRETIPVHLGPQWFVENQDLEIETKDQISVTGSRVTFENKAVIIAAEVRKGEEILALRDEDGVPRWSASLHRRPRMGRGVEGWGPASPYGRLFNPATVETATGKVVDVRYFRARKAAGRGVHLTLQTDRETIPVHLGPAWFVENQEFPIKPDEEIVVRGSRVTADGEMVIIASEVRKGDDVLELRDADGYPRWSGWRRARSGG